MSSTNTLVLIDAGNTSIKVGLMRNDVLTNVKRFTLNRIDEYRKFINDLKPQMGVISSVLSDENSAELLKPLTEYFIVETNTPSPISINYSTPQTLGVDRMCNACAVQSKLQTEHGISIDVGTCIKFDLIDSNGLYLGGSISPGINLRYKALNDYTGKLPLLSNKNTIDIVGNDTETSMQSGVINGVAKELQGFIQSYRDQYESLTFFVTGGDSKYFDLESKNDIFADENLTLLGLYEIYKHNA